MATVVLGVYLVRYPLAGMMANALEYAKGFEHLGHDVWIVERAVWSDACFDTRTCTMTDDPSTGLAAAEEVLARYGLSGRLCFIDVHGAHHGMTAEALRSLLGRADVFVDYGSHGSFADHLGSGTATVLIDGEPGYNQIRMEAAAARGERLAVYDAYFTNGRDIGRDGCDAPTVGRHWQPIFHPVNVDRYDAPAAPPGSAFTTIMNWQSHAEIEWDGQLLGQKDREFDRFQDLPGHVSSPLEIAVSGAGVPTGALRAAGWRVVSGHDVSRTYDRYRAYLDASLGEFAVVKEVFRALRTAWFSDRSAAYLANGRPVVLQETGWSSHLPTGEGLFAVQDMDEAAAALDAIATDWARHSRAAREIAREHLDARAVLPAVLRAAGC